MAKAITSAKESISTLMAIFAVAKDAVDRLVPKESVDANQVDTIIANKIIEKCEKAGGTKA